MPGKLYKAQTKEEIIALFHPELINQIPTDLLNEVAQSILNLEISTRLNKTPSPEEINTSNIFTYYEDQITRVDYNGQTFNIA